RSSTGLGALVTSCAARSWPKPPQKRYVDGLTSPHDGHTSLNAAPHEPQNRCTPRFSWPQAGHVVVPPTVVEATGRATRRRPRDVGGGRRPRRATARCRRRPP